MAMDQEPRLAPRTLTVRSIKDWISSGRFPVGEWLPAERLLADELGVARGTLRSALADLERDGWIECRSAHRRLVLGAPQREGMMARAIALLTIAFKPADDELVGSGWGRFLDLAALDAIGEAGYHAVTVNTARGDEALSQLREEPPAGVILTEYGLQRGGLEALQRLGLRVPIVAYGDDPRVQGCDRIVPDQTQGGRDLAAELLRRGRRRFLLGWSGDQQAWFLRDRSRGIAAICAEHDLPQPRQVALPGTQETGGVEAVFQANVRVMAGWLAEHLVGENRPDVIFAPSDRPAYLIAAALRLFGLEPGREVLVVGYDNIYEGVLERRWESSAPVLTVDRRVTRCGEEMVSLLRERLEGQLPSEPQRRLVAPRLVATGA